MNRNRNVTTRSGLAIGNRISACRGHMRAKAAALSHPIAWFRICAIASVVTRGPYGCPTALRRRRRFRRDVLSAAGLARTLLFNHAVALPGVFIRGEQTMPKMPTEQVGRMMQAVTGADALWWFGYAAYGVFHVVSLSTTTYGIGVVMQVDGVGWVVPFLISLAVQTMIGVSGHRLQRARGWRLRAASVPILLICISISIGFAFGFWWHLLRSESVARDIAVEQSDRITRPVQAFTHHLSVAADSLDRLAAYSADRAATERRAGGTCEAAVGDGAGPRTRLREADDRMFGLLAERFRSTAANAETAVNELQTLRETYDPASHDAHEAAVNRVMLRVRPLVTASYEPTIAQLEARIARGRGELVDDQTGERYRCRDSHLGDFVREAIGTLQQLQGVREDVPAELDFHRPDQRTSLAFAYRQLATLLRFATADHRSPAPEAADLVPLLLALTVDVVIFMVPFLFPQNDGDGDGDGRDYVAEINAAVEPDPRTPDTVTDRLLSFAFNDDACRTPYDILDRFRVEGRRHDEILLPFDLETTESRAARKLLQALERRPYVRQLHLKPAQRRKLRQDLGDARLATLYRLEPEFMADLAKERVRQSSASRADVPRTTPPAEAPSSRCGPLGVAS